ncbi:MAG: RNA polymerase-binding protein DksA [Deltaproteobacteria bacterium RIFCSPHIGHO2_12_FULL_43_9]|nr:MAG: RNA polymerase-binding protein DksA [Deltaproteobacteria bacterium RIFCSPHIGHO2_12_FULL_43_9]
MGLTTKELQNFKNILLQKRKNLLLEAKQTLGEIDETSAMVPDTTDQASLEADRAFLLRIRDRERKLISKIDESLVRIGNNTFGICQECGEEIGKKRLDARPETTLCVNCKEEAEEKEQR